MKQPAQGSKNEPPTIKEQRSYLDSHSKPQEGVLRSLKKQDTATERNKIGLTSNKCKLNCQNHQRAAITRNTAHHKKTTKTR